MEWNALNDIQLTIDIFNEMVPQHGDTQLALETYQSIFGFPILDYYKRIGFNFEIESLESLANRFIEQ